MIINIRFKFLLAAFVCLTGASLAHAQKDTLRVMGYNVLYYGNGCQGPNGYYHGYMKTIIAYTDPDIISLEKMASIPVSPDDKYGVAPLGFADSILDLAFNAAYPGRYAHCPFTNNAKANNMSVLFYDKHKLGFIEIVSSYTNITDFNTYKLYYKDPNLQRTHDTTFIYVTPNHDKSGDEFVKVRGHQIAAEMNGIKKHFTRLPNMVEMGDFNVRNSDEPCYRELTATPDSSFLFYDPPFYPDHDLFYPADWDHNPKFASFFTTATREMQTPCGSGGGAKNWYDHIFLSSWIVNNVNYVRYIPHSYRTVGNDGNRFRISVNNNNSIANTSAPANVIDALYHMSNKYPVMVSLEVTQNRNGVSPTDPGIARVPVSAKEEITVLSPVGDEMVINIPESMVGEDIILECIDGKGNTQMKKTFRAKKTEMNVKCHLGKGNYKVRFSTPHNLVSESEIIKS